MKQIMRTRFERCQRTDDAEWGPGQLLWKAIGKNLSEFRIHLLLGSNKHTSVSYSIDTFMPACNDLFTRAFILALFIEAKKWEQPTSTNTGRIMDKWWDNLDLLLKNALRREQQRGGDETRLARCWSLLKLGVAYMKFSYAILSFVCWKFSMTKCLNI